MSIPIMPVNLLTDVGAVPRSAKVQAPENEGGFQSAMANALQSTSNLQKQAGQLSREFTLENPTVSLEQTMLAGVKSNIAFQTTLQVRNKLVQSYSDIMNMQI